jgi:hypothetical protein
MLTAQQIGDHIEIEQLQQRYFRSMDTWDYDLLERVFAPEAVVRYEALAGADAPWREMVPRFREFNRHFSFMQHLGGQLLIELEGDRARSSHAMRAIHVQTTLEGEENRWAIYGLYRDRLRRTPEGWRIAERLYRGMRTEGELLPFDRVKRYDAPPWL